jgi:CRISPR-associated endonuclease/helicase Cas3
MLKEYIAKTDKTSLEDHNKELTNILKQIIDIYDIENIKESLNRCIEYHDIGKCSDSMQNRLKGKDVNFIRHEWVGASVEDLTDGERLAILTHHKDISKSLELIDNDKYISELEEIKNKLNIKLNNIDDFVKKVNKPRCSITKDLDNILLKGYLNYCDHLCSAGNITIDKGFNSLDRFKFNNYNSIQNKAMNTREDVLIQAMTGLGKTAASLLWSNNVQNEDKSKRIYYILPFTASINSLYKDFLNRNISTTMLHNKAEYFMDKLHDEYNYKLMKYSTKQLNICTIFQLAKAIFSCKNFEMIIAQMKNSIIMVDEIHCFDLKTLSYILELLRFLKYKLGCRICIMSASIPTVLQKLIKDRLDINKVIYADKRDLKIRHRIHRVNKTILDDIEKIENDLREGKQVIVCVNNVTTSQIIYKIFKDKYKCKLIHGRFNTRDREIAEQGLKVNQLLVGTQAIEVSLDISYDTMYTEIAPYDALLQRFGRVNRRGEKGIRDIYIYNNYNKCIYDDELINNTDLVIDEIIHNDNRIILEEKVEHYLDKVYTYIDIISYNKYSNSLEKVINNLRVGNYNKNSIKEMIQGDTVSVIPECLLEEYQKLINDREYLKAQSLKLNINSNRMKYNSDMFYICDDLVVSKYKYTYDLGMEFE